MLEGVKKLGRAIWRDHLEGLALTGATAIALASAGTAALIGFSVGSFFAAFGVMIVAGIGSWVPVMFRKMAESYAGSGFRSEKQPVQFDRLHGPARKIKIIFNTQTMLSESLYKYRDAPVLPAKLMKKFEPWLKDAEEAARHVRSVDPTTSLDQPTFAFTRVRYGTFGTHSHETVAEIPLLHSPPPWELERQRREALDAEIAAVMNHGAATDMTVRTLRLKPKSGPSQ